MPRIKSVEPSHPIVPSGAVKYLSPYHNSYYDESLDDSVKIASISSSSAILPHKDSQKVGWSSTDTIEPAPKIDNITQIGKRVQPALTDVQPKPGAALTLSSEMVNVKEAEAILDIAYAQLPVDLQEAADLDTAEAAEKLDNSKLEAVKRNRVEHHIETLSKKIDEALSSEGMDYEQLHGYILKYCMLYMRKLAKDDQEYISKIGEQIMIKAGQIKDTYNTWPVVTLTLVSSGVSVIAAASGFSVLAFPDKVVETSTLCHKIVSIAASNAQQIGTLSTGISGLSSIAEKQNESTRNIKQLEQRRSQEKEEEKKTAKQGNNENKKRFFSEIQEMFRNMAATIRAILTGG